MSGPNVDTCQYIGCRADPSEDVDGPDGVYWYCSRHAKEMVAESNWFDWRAPDA